MCVAKRAPAGLRAALNKFLDSNLVEASPQVVLFLDSRLRGNDRAVQLSKNFATVALEPLTK